MAFVGNSKHDLLYCEGEPSRPRRALFFSRLTYTRKIQLAIRFAEFAVKNDSPDEYVK